MRKKTNNINRKSTPKNILFVFLVLFMAFYPLGNTVQAVQPVVDAAANSIATKAYLLQLRQEARLVAREASFFIEEGLLGTIKQEALIFMDEEVTNTIDMLSGRNSVKGVTDGFIENWEAFLIEEPGNQAASYMEEFLFNATGGRSGANYRTRVGRSGQRYSSLGAEGFGNGQTYYYGLIKTASAQNENAPLYNDDGGAAYREQMKLVTKAIETEKQDQWGPAVSEMDYERNPKLMFAKDNFRDLDIYTSGINNPWSYQQYKSMKLENQYQNKKMELMLRSLICRGVYADSIQDCLEVSAQKDKLATADLEATLNASNWRESVVTFAFMKVNKVLRAGIRNVRKSYQQDLAAYRRQIMTSFTANFTGLRPQDIFREQLQDRQARDNKFSTGANYEAINVEQELRRRQTQ